MRLSIRTIAIIVAIAAVLVLAAVFVPRLSHFCDNCERFFIGTGYSAAVLSDWVTNLTGQDEKILCKDCAMQEHALEIALGKSLEDFKLPLFSKKD